MTVIVQRPSHRNILIGGFAPMYQHPRAGEAGLGLLDNLIAYWPGNEASGNLIDAHTNGLNLTDINTVTNNTGKVYATARQYTKANNEYHTRVDDAFLSLGADSDVTFATWLYLDTNAATMWSFSKRAAGPANIEYQLLYNITTNRLGFTVGDGLGNTGPAIADTLGLPSTATWYFVVGWHDATNDTVNIQVDNGTVDSVGYALGTQDAANPFRIGGYKGISATEWDGRIGPTAMWKSAAGGGGVLTAAQRTALWNSGNGLAYASFT